MKLWSRFMNSNSIRSYPVCISLIRNIYKYMTARIFHKNELSDNFSKKNAIFLYFYTDHDQTYIARLLYCYYYINLGHNLISVLWSLLCLVISLFAMSLFLFAISNPLDAYIWRYLFLQLTKVLQELLW